MRVFLLLAALILGVSCSPVPQNSDDLYTYKLCTGNIKNLWLDVMVVVDKSQLMTNAQLWQVRNTLTQVLGSISTIGPVKYPADPRSTCVGVVTYDDNATTQSQLDASTSFSDLYNVIQSSMVAVDNTNNSYLSLGLLAAEKAFKDGRSRTFRYNYRKVVIAFVADYQGQGTSLDAMPIAKRLKDNTVSIITVACTSDPVKQAAIAAIASPGLSLIDEMDTPKLVKQLTNALVSVNCFCPKDWAQFRTDINNDTSPAYTVCIAGFKATGGSYGYKHAIEYCADEEKSAHLANEFSKEKHDFDNKYMETTFTWEFSKIVYYIGLNYYKQWIWETPAGQSDLPFNPSVYSKWAPGWPQANSTDQVISNQKWIGDTSGEYFWAPPQTNDWLFLCQVESSSTEHYTDFSQF
ncbi:hypothetical protein B9Z55_005657 [Caenorhabditis nigoni]|uniref:VWFA domain-containing protein n=1 Tax=Caenorhabditis nigoni TaxID=1611254 RepID=A0A2G5V1X0_9PELO|nr:hypothetical protein B9Z55_005657 [Caenorhabditis nigoni]